MRGERAEGEIHMIMVALVLLSIVMMFPDTVMGFIEWVGDGVYSAFDAGDSPVGSSEPAPAEPEPAK
jgi:hypothetical protein